MEPKVDLIYNGQGQGQIAQFIANKGKLDVGLKRPFEWNGKSYISVYVGGDPKEDKSYRTMELGINAATLRRDEWKRLDDALVEPARYRLGGVDDLISKGLVYNLGNGMGTTILEWHDVSDAGEAEITMNGVSRAKNDRPVYQHNYLPIPIVHADYEIDYRELVVSRNMGNPLDTTMAERAARRVSEKIENMLFTDVTYQYGETDSRGRNKIYSYLNFPDRNVASYTALPGAKHWDDSGMTGEYIVKQVSALKQILLEAHQNGPYMLYIPYNYETVVDLDYSTEYPGVSIRKRILDIKNILDVKVIDTLPVDTVLLVQMNKETVRLVQGMGVQNIQWQEEGGMVLHMKVMTIQVPQIRSDQNGKCGIVHLS